MHYLLPFITSQCVVSSWSEWSACDDDCIFRQTRKRTRQITRRPDPTGANAALLVCPSLLQSEDCKLGHSCFEYRWNLSSWSNCMLDDGAFCGKGKRQRFLRCLRVFDNRDMPLEYCKRMGKTPIPPEKKTNDFCEVPCPSDCKLTGILRFMNSFIFPTPRENKEWGIERNERKRKIRDLK